MDSLRSTQANGFYVVLRLDDTVGDSYNEVISWVQILTGGGSSYPTARVRKPVVRPGELRLTINENFKSKVVCFFEIIEEIIEIYHSEMINYINSLELKDGDDETIIKIEKFLKKKSKSFFCYPIGENIPAEDAAEGAKTLLKFPRETIGKLEQGEMLQQQGTFGNSIADALIDVDELDGHDDLVGAIAKKVEGSKKLNKLRKLTISRHDIDDNFTEKLLNYILSLNPYDFTTFNTVDAAGGGGRTIKSGARSELVQDNQHQARSRACRRRHWSG